MSTRELAASRTIEPWQRHIVDEVEKTGKPVTILRHGKPAAVVISPEQYRRKFQKSEWKLAGSLIPVEGVDLEKALEELSKERAEISRLGLQGLAKDFQDD